MQSDKYEFSNAIDVALKHNQIRAIGLIINHIVTFQNNYVSSYLFNDNLLQLLEKGIDIICLLKSNVFQYKFDFEGWPRVHPDTSKITVPYNGDLFHIR